METLRLKLEGLTELMMHNERLADPTSRWAKDLKTLAKKRNKSDDDVAALKRAEWEGGLYENETGAPVVPVDWILAATLGGAKRFKYGPLVKAGVYAIRAQFPLQFPFKKKTDHDALFADERFVDYRGVVVSRARVMRCRPKFPQWSLDVELGFDPKTIDRAQVVQALEAAGNLIGIGDYRPRFGRFTVATA